MPERLDLLAHRGDLVERHAPVIEASLGRDPLRLGEDRFDLLFWTLERSGLTKRTGHATLPTKSWTSP